jgi:hypothetical protein
MRTTNNGAREEDRHEQGQHIIERAGNVFDDLAIAEAAAELVKAQLTVVHLCIYR